MNESKIYCPNEKCKHYRIIDAENIVFRQMQGKTESIKIFQCITCKTSFSERKGSVYFNIRKSEFLFDFVLQLSLYRLPVRSISEITKISEKAIRRWVKKASEFLLEFHKRMIETIEVSECQIDEMWSFVLMKKKTARIQGRENDLKIGDQWIFIALDAVNKVVIHWKTCKRTLKNAKLFLSEVKSIVGTKPFFTTDKWQGYETAFLSVFIDNSEFDADNKNESLKYAQLEKIRENGKVIDLDTHIISGSEEEIQKILDASPVSNCINTSFIERYNGTARQKNSRLVRQTYSFSKKLTYHEAYINFNFVAYNFVSVHSRLKKTAAQMAGLVDKVLTLHDIFKNKDFALI